MKNLNALNLPEEMALAIQNFIYNAVCSTELILVFYTPIVNSKLNLLTLIVDKQNYDKTVSTLQPQIEDLDALKHYHTLISINYHQVSSKDSHFHFSFLQLHLQPQFVIYSNHLNSWNSLFQNFYSNNKQKVITQFENYNKEIKNSVNEAISKFVKPLINEQLYEAAYVALLKVCSFYFELLKNILLPKSLHQLYNEEKFTVFVETYYVEFSKILHKMAKMKSRELKNQTQYRIGLNPLRSFDKKINEISQTIKEGIKQATKFYHKRIDFELLPEPNEKKLLKQLIAFLVSGHKIDVIYLLGSCNHQTYKLKLLIISPTLRIQHHDALIDKVRIHFNGNIEVFCLIHTLEWLQQKENLHQLFFNKYLVPENIIYVRKYLDVNRSKYVHQKNNQIQYLQKQYLQERLTYIFPWLCAFQQQNLMYQRGHILLLKNVLQQLILALLYQKIQYTPSIYSYKYLLPLFQTLLPETYNLYVEPHEEESILTTLSHAIEFHPKTHYLSQEIDQSACAKILCLCQKLFNEIQLSNNLKQ